MTKERIEEIKKSKERAYKRQFDNYQATGEQKYYSAMVRYEEIVDLCDMALSEVVPRRELGFIKASLITLGDKADTVLHKYPEGYFMPMQPSDLADFYRILKEVVAVASLHGYDSKWG